MTTPPRPGKSVVVGEIVAHMRESFALVFGSNQLRRLILESMSFEGYFKASKDYLQPVLKMAAVPLAALLFAGLDLTEKQSSVILIGPVYFLLFLGSAVASRQARRSPSGRLSRPMDRRTGHSREDRRNNRRAALAVLLQR